MPGDAAQSDLRDFCNRPQRVISLASSSRPPQPLVGDRGPRDLPLPLFSLLDPSFYNPTFVNMFQGGLPQAEAALIGQNQKEARPGMPPESSSSPLPPSPPGEKTTTCQDQAG